MMKLKYLSHSSFLINCGETKLIFDPWLRGPAYYRQWYLWPLPAEGSLEIKADAILITHGHEDHLHSETLKSLDKNSAVFFPFQWREGISFFLNHLGFKEVTEAITFKTYSVNDVKITYISFSLESVVVIEYKDEVLVNINDALNSNHENAVAFILKEITTRWKKVKYLLSGWSGASYFPNQIRFPGKDDMEIGKIREQYFADNFCKFTQIIKPEYAIPFCPGFVLLKPQNKWINEIKFARSRVDGYYKEYFEGSCAIRFISPYPGDEIENGYLCKRSYLHGIEENKHPALAYEHYKPEIDTASKINFLTVDKVDLLIKKLDYWMNYNKRLYHMNVLFDSVFSIYLADLAEPTYLNILFDKNKRFIIMKSKDPLPERRLTINTSAEKLLFAFTKIWGGDILTIGYGLTIDVYDRLSLEKNLDIVCVRLITRYPMARKDLVKNPLRVLKFYALNPKITSLWIKQKIVLKPYVNKYPYNERDHWLSYNKCDLCAVCKMPEINLNLY